MPMKTMWVTRSGPSVASSALAAISCPTISAAREIALEAHGAGEAEGARIAAADLGRHAERDAPVVRHQHRAARARRRPGGRPACGCRPATASRRSTSGSHDLRGLGERARGSRAAGRTWRRAPRRPCDRSRSPAAVRDSARRPATRRDPRARWGGVRPGSCATSQGRISRHFGREFSTGAVPEGWITRCGTHPRCRIFSRLDRFAHSMSTEAARGLW